MKILAVIDSFGIGGAESQLARVLNYFVAERAHECTACSLGPMLRTEVLFDTRVRRVYLNKKSPAHFSLLVGRLAQLIRGCGADVVYSRLPLSNALCRLVTWLPGCRVRHVAGIDTVPDLFTSSYGTSPLTYAAYTWFERRADLVLCISEATASAALRRGYPREQVRVVFNGIDVAEFHPCADMPDFRPTRLTCVAGLRPEKGVSRLIRLIPSIVAQHPVRLSIIGDGVERQGVENLIAQLALENIVVLLGARRDVATLLRDADIYVSAAYVEGFGIAVAEAAASGLPAVVFTAPGGLNEIVINGETGFVIPSDREDLFVEAVVKLCRDADLWRRMGRAARDYVVRNFSLAEVAQQLEVCLWP